LLLDIKLAVFLIRYLSEVFCYKKIYKDLLKQGKILPIVNDDLISLYLFNTESP